jgi:hypothetical protein
MSAAAPDGVQALLITRTNGASLRFLMDVAVGGSGSEFVVAEDLAFTVTDQYRSGAWAQVVPLSVPAGARVAFRTQSDGASRANEFSLSFVVGGGLYPTGSGKVTTYGAIPASTEGTSVVGGFLVYGASVEFVASTPAPVRAIGVQQIGLGVGNGLTSRARVLAGSQDIGAVWAFSQFMTEAQFSGSGICFFPCSIPAGVQLNIQHADDANVGATRRYILYTVS